VPLASPEEDGAALQFWLVDGKVRGFRFPAFSEEELERRQQQVGRKFAEAKEARELGNVGLRLEHMDATGVDVQVLHNTMFITQVTDRAPVEVALCGSWNRWLADIWSQSEGRLRWSCLAPTLSITDALDQIRFGKEHGACAVLMRPYEGNRLLVDPYFYPIYEEAVRLDMAIAIHIANFSAPHAYLAERDLLTEESDQHQYRFQTIVDPDSGETLAELEHEVRSLKHPMFKRNLVNRNPAQSFFNYTQGRGSFQP
jgi:predicted TIM-barrel fold metal-dependent hydrolase